MKTSKLKKRGFKILVTLIFLIPIVLFGSDYWIEYSAKNNIYSEIKSIPKHKVGLVLGTSKFLKNGGINPYYSKRIKATIELYQHNKIEFVLVSGDNGHTSYDEPTTFKNDLIEAGIPAQKIFLDYAGFRTLDSIVRAKQIFGQTDLTIISQKFHIERAIYLASHYGIDADGYIAGNYTKRSSMRLRIREKLARTKAVLDVILNVGPKFLGEKITIQ